MHFLVIIIIIIIIIILTAGLLFSSCAVSEDEWSEKDYRNGFSSTIFKFRPP